MTDDGVGHFEVDVVVFLRRISAVGVFVKKLYVIIYGRISI